jgi:RNA polymerase sigma factor (sigma-70 family)
MIEPMPGNQETWTTFLKALVATTINYARNKRIPLSIVSKNDLSQQAWTAMLKADQNYNPEKAALTGAKYSTYAYAFVTWELKKFIQRAVKHTVKFESTECLDAYPSRHHDDFAAIDRHDSLEFALNSLSEEKRRYVKSHYLDGMSYRAMQAAEGVPRTAIRRDVIEALSSMKANLRADNTNY